MPKIRPMNCYEFGRGLLKTNDLDPVYVLLWNAGLDGDVLRRWLLAYFCFYHVGTASWICSGRGDESEYWNRILRAAGSKDYPRSSERRHFRGSQAISSVTWLMERGLDHLWGPLQGRMSLEEVIRLVKCWRGFGDWIAFKVADMLERLGLAQVQFDGGALMMFDSPRKGAELLWDQHNPGLNNIREPDGVLNWAVDMILGELGSLLAPPRYERQINVQEVETILCKWSSYSKGKYHIGEDIRSSRSGLAKFGRCALAQKLYQGGRIGGLW